MKRIIYPLLLVASLVILPACGNGKKTPNEAEKPKDKQSEVQKEPQDVPEKEPEKESEKEPDNEIQDEPEQKKISKDNPDIDKDYKGNISCPLPPMDSTYKIYTDDNNSLVLYIENIDDANFKFYFTKAVLTDVQSNEHERKIDEEVIFTEHIAHYNGDGFYEYEGEDYHLYFRYSVVSEHYVTGKVVEVYGQEGLYSTKEYGDYMQYNGLEGNRFVMGLPFAG